MNFFTTHSFISRALQPYTFDGGFGVFGGGLNRALEDMGNRIGFGGGGLFGGGLASAELLRGFMQLMGMGVPGNPAIGTNRFAPNAAAYTGADPLGAMPLAAPTFSAPTVLPAPAPEQAAPASNINASGDDEKPHKADESESSGPDGADAADKPKGPPPEKVIDAATPKLVAGGWNDAEQKEIIAKAKQAAGEDGNKLKQILDAVPNKVAQRPDGSTSTYGWQHQLGSWYAEHVLGLQGMDAKMFINRTIKIPDTADGSEPDYLDLKPVGYENNMEVYEIINKARDGATSAKWGKVKDKIYYDRNVKKWFKTVAAAAADALTVPEGVDPSPIGDRWMIFKKNGNWIPDGSLADVTRLFARMDGDIATERSRRAAVTDGRARVHAQQGEFVAKAFMTDLAAPPPPPAPSDAEVLFTPANGVQPAKFALTFKPDEAQAVAGKIRAGRAASDKLPLLPAGTKVFINGREWTVPSANRGAALTARIEAEASIPFTWPSGDKPPFSLLHLSGEGEALEKAIVAALIECIEKTTFHPSEINFGRGTLQLPAAARDADGLLDGIKNALAQHFKIEESKITITDILYGPVPPKPGEAAPAAAVAAPPGDGL